MGKASKQRVCPAVGRAITPAECGENRGSRYACPAECPHNPFAPALYDQLLAIEGGLDRETLQRLGADPYERAARVEAMRRSTVAPSDHAAHAQATWEIFFRRAEDGTTFAQRWERAGFPGLKNDARVLFRAKMQMRIGLLEVRRVIDAQTVELVDLFTPEAGRIRVVDRSFAARAVRFSTTLSWVFPLPHFHRLSGTAIGIVDLGPYTPADILRETMQHLGAPAAGEERARWLAENFVRIDDSIAATAHERRRRMFASIDVQFTTTWYELRAPLAECRTALEAETDQAEETPNADDLAAGFTHMWVWFDDAPEARLTTVGEGRPILGTVWLGPKRARIEAGSAARSARLRARFEARLGARVVFESEKCDDIGQRFALEEPAGDSTLIPAALLEHEDRFAMGTSRMAAPIAGSSHEDFSALVKSESLRGFADQPIPALEGCTPRAAAADPALRPRLLTLVKGRVRDLDEENLRTGRRDDINWLIRELGLHELDEPPPPARARLVGDDAEDVMDDDDLFGPPLPPLPAKSGAGRLSRPPVDLPPRPFTHDEAVDRLRDSLAQFDTAAAAMNALEACGVTWLDDWYEITDGLIDEEHYSVLVPFLLMVWFSFLPQGAALPPLDRDAVRARMLRSVEGLLSRDVNVGDAARQFLSGTRQPAFTEVVLDHFLRNVGRLPKKARPNEAAQAAMTLALRTAVDELDHALRP